MVEDRCIFTARLRRLLFGRLGLVGERNSKTTRHDDQGRRIRMLYSDYASPRLGLCLMFSNNFSLWNFLGWKFVCVAMDSVFYLILFLKLWREWEDYRASGCHDGAWSRMMQAVATGATLRNEGPDDWSEGKPMSLVNKAWLFVLTLFSKLYVAR